MNPSPLQRPLLLLSCSARTSRTARLLQAALLALMCAAWLALIGCSPQVGDSCLSSNECPTGGICDTSAPEGYCTETPCEANSCPEEASCVDFGNDETYCMLRCGSDDDCRAGYTCRSDVGAVKFCYVSP